MLIKVRPNVKMEREMQENVVVRRGERERQWDKKEKKKKEVKMRNRKKGLQKILISRTSKEKPILKTETQKSGYDRQIKRREILRGLSEQIMMHAYIHTTTHIWHFVLIVHSTMGVLMVMLMMC